MLAVAIIYASSVLVLFLVLFVLCCISGGMITDCIRQSLGDNRCKEKIGLILWLCSLLQDVTVVCVVCDHRTNYCLYIDLLRCPL